MRKLKTLSHISLILIVLAMIFGIGSVPVNALFENRAQTVHTLANKSITTKKSLMILGKGEVIDFNSYITSGRSKIKKWVSSNKKVIRVKDGIITAVGTGSATLRIYSTDGSKTTCIFKVKNAPKSVLLSKGVLTIGAGEKYTITASTNDGSASSVISFRTSNSNVVKMLYTNGKARFYGSKPGVAYVTARTYNGIEKACKVTVMKSPKKLTLSRTSLSLGIGETYTLTASVNKSSGASSLTFASDNSSIVKMLRTDTTGEFTAIKRGTTTVTVEAYNGVSAECKVKVMSAPKKIELSKGILTLGVGEKYVLNASTDTGSASASMKFRTSNSSIVRMTRTDGRGEFVAVKEGTAYVTVRTYNGIEKACKVTVKSAPKSVSLSKGILTLEVGDGYSLSAKTDNGIGNDSLVFRTSNSSIIKMTRTNGKGEFLAMKSGTAYVTVRTYNGKEKACKITVVDPEKGISLNKSVVSVNAGASEQILLHDTGSSEKLVFKCADTSVATVDANGNVKGLSSGNTNITVISDSGGVENIEVIVYGKNDTYGPADPEEIDRYLNSVKLVPVKTNFPEIDNAVDKIFAQVTNNNMTPAQKARACYDYLVKNCTYTSPTYPVSTGLAYRNDEDDNIVNKAYSILLFRKGVCDNYSAAYVVMLRRIGIPANLTNGLVSKVDGGFTGHAWVDVNINEKHFILDPEVESKTYLSDHIDHFYFFGKKPETNHNMYLYGYTIYCHNFKTLPSAKGNKYFTTAVKVSSGNTSYISSIKIPDGHTIEWQFDGKCFDKNGKQLSDPWIEVRKEDLFPITFDIEMKDGPLPYSANLELSYYDDDTEYNKTVEYSKLLDRCSDRKPSIKWTSDNMNKKGSYRIRLEIIYSEFGFLGDDYSTVYFIDLDVK